MSKHRVLLVDDHRIVVDGIKSLVEQRGQFEVVAAAGRPQQALSILQAQPVDILITDYEMPGMSGLELVQQAKAILPELKVIVLSMHEDSAVIRELIKAGINGFVQKKDTHHSLLAALQRVVEGKRYLSAEVSEILMQALEEKPNESSLTPREQEIIKLIVQEHTTKEIASLLFISERTVETHRK
ncbi:MAG: response regulator transcription factor, partial [Bacteroidota bacterium]